jgi:hypothetical protein
MVEPIGKMQRSEKSRRDRGGPEFVPRLCLYLGAGITTRLTFSVLSALTRTGLPRDSS